MIYKRSSALFAEAEQVIPGGVNSPVRAFKAVGGTPRHALLLMSDGCQPMQWCGCFREVVPHPLRA